MASVGSDSSSQSTDINSRQLAALSKLLFQGDTELGATREGFRGLPEFGAQLGQQGQGIVSGLQGAGSGLEQFIGQGSTDQQIEGVTGVAQNFLNQNLNNIGGQSNVAGGFGGGRSQVAQGAAIGQAAAGLGGVTSQILGQDMFRRQQAAGQQGQQQLAGAGLGLQGLESIFGLQSGGLLSAFGGLQNQRGLIGNLAQQGSGGSSGSSFGVLDFF